MTDFEDKPGPEFLARLNAFEPRYAEPACIKEVAELLLVLAEAPIFVQNCIDGLLKGACADGRFRRSIVHFLDSGPNHESPLPCQVNCNPGGNNV